ncbi:MAG: BMP family ABC transporter substrate-binding protein [Bacillota bacterium]
MKKVFALLATLVLAFTLVACGDDDDDDTGEYDIAMITDAGDIDDESFNQGTWEGIVAYAELNDISHRYYRPAEVSDQAYIDAINLAVRNGAEIVITPGFLFEVAIHTAQEDHPDVTFVIIDGAPHPGDYNINIGENTVSVMFAEQESGFLAGYAAVVDGYRDLGFMGGMAVPAVQKFGIGFIAGAYYAADELDVEISFPDNRYDYLGNFDATAENKDAALAWYNSGTEIIFAAAGGAGSSVMAAADDEGKMMIGVDVDQASLSTTVLTSAKKELAISIQDILSQYYDNDFPGGEQVIYDASNDGIGLPMNTSRFEDFGRLDYYPIYLDIALGELEVPTLNPGDDDISLEDFFTEHGLDDLDIEIDTIIPPSS